MGDTIDKTDDGSGGTPPAGTTETPSSSSSTESTGDQPASGGDGDLGEAGKRAIAAERQAARDAQNHAKSLERELEELKRSQLSEQDRAVAEARAAGAAEATSAANTKLARAEAIAKAAGKLKDPELAPGLLGDLTGYVDDNGDIDGERIATDIDELLSSKPYLGLDHTPPATGDTKVETPPPGTVPGGPVSEQQTTFKRSQLRDPTFYAANKDAILKAAAEGRIVDDV